MLSVDADGATAPDARQPGLQLHDEYAIASQEGDAFEYGRAFYAIALEVDGKIVPFMGREAVYCTVRRAALVWEPATRLLGQTMAQWAPRHRTLARADRRRP